MGHLSWSVKKKNSKRLHLKPSIFAELETAVQVIWSSISLHYVQSFTGQCLWEWNCVLRQGKLIQTLGHISWFNVNTWMQFLLVL